MGREADLNAHKLIMVTYLKLKLEESDWHGIADAAMDIREIDAKLEIINELKIKRN